MSELQLVNDRLEALISSLSAPARKEMARSIGRKLRASQQQNIKRQQAPDGTPFKPRKTQPVRSKKGRIKREMFAKLRTTKYLKIEATPSEAIVGFESKVQHLANVHHYGLKDRPRRNIKEVLYNSRPLLGLTSNHLSLIQDVITEALAENSK
ncbi:phage virion morphogenesis protein [Pantoea sp. ARC270]|uniref:phage virion morphogenesis protein n=1 Tax=Pantoea sp. ARC270 TaxID=2027923 RepID=UPI000DA8D651|nr:phage virion morphogenesis protein [Pantoea sp. ARC270]PZL88299.1 phage virion morphogenesis protein [Pantoea sp. ARC270]